MGIKRTIPTARLQDTEAEQKKLRIRRSNIRAIDKGTQYDVSGKLRRVIHEIEGGKHGEVTDVVCAIRCVQGGVVRVRTIYTGKNTMAELNLMVDFLKKDVVG